MSGILSWLVWGTVVTAALVAVALPFAARDARQWKRRLEEAFAGRAPLDAPTFYEKYFRAKGVPAFIVIQIRDILEEVFEADLRRISAADDLTTNLGFLFEFNSTAALELVERLEEEFHIRISNAEFEGARTVEGIVNLVWSKLSAAPGGTWRDTNP